MTSQGLDSIWDIPGMTPNDNFVKFENPGDTVTGVITQLGAHTWEDGKISPQITFAAESDGEDERVLTASQVRLKALLAEARPMVGDTLTVTYTSSEPRAGGKTLKHFTVDVERAGQPKPAANAQPAAAGDASVAFTPEQVAAMSPAQRQALGLDSSNSDEALASL